MCQTKSILTLVVLLLFSVVGRVFCATPVVITPDSLKQPVKAKPDANPDFGMKVFDKSKFYVVPNTMAIKGTVKVITNNRHTIAMTIATSNRTLCVNLNKMPFKPLEKQPIQIISIPTETQIAEKPAKATLLPYGNNPLGNDFLFNYYHNRNGISTTTTSVKKNTPNPMSAFLRSNAIAFNQKEPSLAFTTNYKAPHASFIAIYGNNDWANRPPPV